MINKNQLIYKYLSIRKWISKKITIYTWDVNQNRKYTLYG